MDDPQAITTLPGPMMDVITVVVALRRDASPRRVMPTMVVSPRRVDLRFLSDLLRLHVTYGSASGGRTSTRLLPVSLM